MQLELELLGARLEIQKLYKKSHNFAQHNNNHLQLCPRESNIQL